MEEKLEGLEILPEYTPVYVVEQFKIYLERKGKSKYDFFAWENTLILVNYAKNMRNITEEQAAELKEILEKVKNQ